MEADMIHRLIDAARQAQEKAYAPYSHFTVGAAVLGGDDVIYTGCNVENASYSMAICAERNALFHGVACGCRTFRALAVVGDSADFITPCGACRQVMAEFHVAEIILTKADNTYKIVTLQDILPYMFDNTSLVEA